MEIIIQPTYTKLAEVAAEILRDALLKKPNLVLGLATGSTPIGLYEALIRMHQTEGLDFSEVTTFNLDEYAGIPPDHPHSYHTFMETHFFSAVNIRAENCHIPQSTVVGHEEFCERYEAAIVAAGGIDIQVLGIGKDGHIGFNEPSSSLGSRTRIKTLTQRTLEANAPHFGGAVDTVPENGDYNGGRYNHGSETVSVTGERRIKSRSDCKRRRGSDYGRSTSFRVTDASTDGGSH